MVEFGEFAGASLKPDRAISELCQTSRFLHADDAIAVRADASFDDLASARRNKLLAVAAAHFSVGLVLVLHCFLRRLLLCARLLAWHGGSQSCANQEDRRFKNGTALQLAHF